jgi:hypothetical protein
MQVGKDGTNYDVKFFGASSGAFAFWNAGASKLELRGQNDAPGKLSLTTAETSVVDGNKLGQIDFQAPIDSAGTDAILVGASIYAEADATFSSSVNATELVFATGASEVAAEKMRIASDGKVGIGCADPANNLEVRSAGQAQIRVQGVDQYACGLKIRNNYSSTQSDWNLMAAGGASGWGSTNGSFVIRDDTTNSTGLEIEQGAGDATAAIIIKANGLVGVGTTAPATHLHVHSSSGDGILKISGDNIADSGMNLGGFNGGGFLHTTPSGGGTSSELIRFDGANGRVGIGTTAPGKTLEVRGAWNELLRLKPTSGKYVDFSTGTVSFAIGVNDNATGGVTIAHTGAVTHPATPAFSMKATSQTNMATDGNVTITWPTEDYDVGSNVSSNVFTAPVTGKYLMCITANLYTIDQNATAYGIHLLASNRTYESWWGTAQWDTDGKVTCGLSHVIDMDASDTVYWYFYQGGGSAQTDLHADSRWTGMLVG